MTGAWGVAAAKRFELTDLEHPVVVDSDRAVLDNSGPLTWLEHRYDLAPSQQLDAHGLYFLFGVPRLVSLSESRGVDAGSRTRGSGITIGGEFALVSKAMTFDLVVSGRLVLPERIIESGWLGITTGKIMEVGEGAPAGASRCIDAGGKLVFPGVIDGQIHAGSAAGIEGLADATVAAAAGGVTTVVDMPFDNPDSVNTLACMETKIELIDARASVDVALYAAPAKGVEGGNVKTLAERGACAFKVSLYEYHPVRFPGFDLGELHDLFPVIKETGLSVAFHNEVQTIIDRKRGPYQSRAT